jgi:hypothetical protein
VNTIFFAPEILKSSLNPNSALKCGIAETAVIQSIESMD